MAIEKKSGVYKITNILNGKFYVGSSITMNERWQQHRKKLIKGEHHSSKLQNSWNKNGESVFEFSIIEECQPIKEILLSREQYWIDKLNACGPNGYNIAKIVMSPMLGRKHTQETKEKLSILAKNPSKETRIKMSDARKGHEVTTETREKISSARNGRKVSEETRIKNTLAATNPSQETRKKMSDSAKNRPPISEVTRQKMRDAHDSRPPISEDTRKKLSDAAKSKHQQRLSQLPIVLAKILFLLYGMPVDNTPETC